MKYKKSVNINIVLVLNKLHENLPETEQYEFAKLFAKNKKTLQTILTRAFF